MARTRRRRVDDGRVAAEDELLDAERLDAELERAPAVGRGVEEDVPVQRRSARRRRASASRSSWIGPPPARIANTTVTSGQRSWPPREPGEVRALHLARVVDDRRGHQAGAPAGGDPATGWTKRKPPSRAARRASARARRGRRARRRRPRRRRSPAAGGRRRAATIRPPAAAASSRIPSSHAAYELVALGGVERLEPERRLQRDDGDVDLVRGRAGASRASSS